MKSTIINKISTLTLRSLLCITSTASLLSASLPDDISGMESSGAREHNANNALDVGLQHLTTATTVNLSDCPLITDAGLAYMTTAREVNLWGCPLITDAGLAYMTTATTVNLSDCPLITLQHASNTPEEHPFNKPLPEADGSYEMSFFGQLPVEIRSRLLCEFNAGDLASLRMVNRNLAYDASDSMLVTKKSGCLTFLNGHDLAQYATMLRDMRHIFTAQQIIPVHVTYSYLSNSDLSHLVNFKRVSLSGFPVTNCCFVDVGNRPGQFITNDGLQYLAHAETVSLSFFSRITDDGLHHLSDATTLDISDCKLITHEGLQRLGGQKKVNLSFFAIVKNPDDLTHIPKMAKRLCINNGGLFVSPRMIRNAIIDLPCLTEIYMGETCFDISDDTAIAFSEHPSLRQAYGHSSADHDKCLVWDRGKSKRTTKNGRGIWANEKAKLETFVSPGKEEHQSYCSIS